MSDKNKKIKCVVWDLDNTMWDGVLIEDKEVTLRSDVLDIIKELDHRGILQSISSKNNYEDAIDKLDEFGIKDYFLYPQISWSSKSQAVKEIISCLNIGANTIAFIDDQDFERDEVKSVIPEVTCFDADEITNILDKDIFIPDFITKDSMRRREMYIADYHRKKVEETYQGPQEDFLASLDMKISIQYAKDEDLDRVIELTERTNQLNTTGYTYSYEELKLMQDSDTHKLLIIGLDDKYGTYGKIGIILIDTSNERWVLELFIMSCRVMSRGIGTILLNYIMDMAQTANRELYAKFIQTEKNKMMQLTYNLAGFKVFEKKEDFILMKNDLSRIQKIPEYVTLISDLPEYEEDERRRIYG
ncbi:HAD-IIIC family phosphatase [Vallitalea guaymasensis]|uniref:HAD-IIIC family phosphatase n=1 Tax=Vallitalea guaymasensis TaxID=1185412 RepID=UPI000DE5300E|nr:HAD-IIIC family phosphatase [Vallitalea guaymasensis]